MKMYILVKNSLERLHTYKDAPEEVSFLRYPHRHVFYVETKIEVFHDDRELEFIMVQHAIKKFLDENMAETDNTSCEQLGEAVGKFIKDTYGDRYVEVSVFEDGENGAIVELPKLVEVN